MPSRSSFARRLSLSGSALALTLALLPPVYAQPAAPVTPAPVAPAPVAPAPVTPAVGTPAPADADPVVARVGTAVLHRSDVLSAQKQLPPQLQQMPLQQIYPLLLDQMVSILVLADAGRKDNLQNDPEVKRQIDTFTNRAIEEAYVNRLVDPALTDEKLRARYDQEVKQNAGKDEVQASHILVADEKTAKDIIAQLDKGGDFAKLAQEKSTDPGSKNGGDLGWFSRDDMVPEFATAAFGLKQGEYTKTPVKTQFGWHVIKVTGRRQSPPPSFEEMKPQLASEITRGIIDDRVKSLRAGQKVETFALDGGPMAAPGLTLAPAAPAGK